MKQIYKKLLAAALGVSMLLSMVGCGQSDTSEQTQTDSEQTQAANENEAKVLTIVTAKELDSLTTLTMNKENNIACGLVYETLVAYEDGKLFPNWPRNGDGMRQILSLPLSFVRMLLLQMEPLLMRKA